jgi:hypothetical protein
MQKAYRHVNRDQEAKPQRLRVDLIGNEPLVRQSLGMDWDDRGRSHYGRSHCNNTLYRRSETDCCLVVPPIALPSRF